MEQARRVLDEVGKIQSIARGAKDQLAGALRLGVIPTIGPYIRPAAVQRDRLHERSFAAVLPVSYIGELANTDLARFGATAYDADPEGMPVVTW